MYVFLSHQFLAESNTQEYFFTTIKSFYYKMLYNVVTNVKNITKQCTWQWQFCHSVIFQVNLKEQSTIFLFLEGEISSPPPQKRTLYKKTHPIICYPLYTSHIFVLYNCEAKTIFVYHCLVENITAILHKSKILCCTNPPPLPHNSLMDQPLYGSACNWRVLSFPRFKRCSNIW